MAKAKAETKMRAIQDQNDSIYICPMCGNDKATQVTKKSFYCIKCDIEFNASGKVYMIMLDGTLADYEVNEFAELI